LTLEFRRKVISKRALFDTHPCFLNSLGQEGYRLVSKLVSKSKYQNLTAELSFDTIVVYETEEVRLPDHCP
jgi:hypothetical protein